MTSRERVHASLARQNPDRVPIFMWFHPQTTKNLASVLEIPERLVGSAMGNDVAQTWVNNNYAMEGVTHEQEGQGHVDDWGIRWEKRGEFNQITSSPLEGKPIEALQSYRFPEERTADLLDLMHEVAAQSRESFLGCDVSPCAFEMYNRIRGMEQAILDLALHPREAGRAIARCAEFARSLARGAVSRYRLDWLWTGDDVASQTAMLMSPSCWRDLIKPALSGVVAVGKEAGLWVAYHCCGSIPQIIDDLIEIGIDVLNPIQAHCPGMDPLRLKERYGTGLAFMGGVDTQWLLPSGTVAQIIRETERLLAGMTRGGGGYILAASHTIPPETPLENVFALYQTAGLSRERIFDTASDLRASQAGP